MECCRTNYFVVQRIGKSYNMKKQLNIVGIFIFSYALLLLASCDRGVVSVGEYEHMRSRAESLQAENDSLQFEQENLKMYVDYLEEENAELIKELNSTPLTEE